MQLQACNFQSWPKFDITIEGLTVLVGPSDLGKSSVLRSLKAVTRNDFSQGFIRIGTTESKVSLREGPLDVEITRTSKGSPEYLLNGEVYKKLQGSVPEELKACGYGSVEIGDLSLDPIFAGQFDAQFGITLTPSQLNQLLGAFASTEKLEVGKREANRRITEANSEAKVFASEISELEKTLVVVGDLVGKISNWTNGVEALETQIEAGEGSTNALGSLLVTMGKLKNIDAVLEAKIPEVDKVQGFLDVLGQVKELEGIRFQIKDLCSVTEDMPEIAFDMVHDIKVRFDALNNLILFGQRLGKLVDIPECDPSGVRLLNKLLVSLDEESGILRDIQTRTALLEPINLEVATLEGEIDSLKESRVKEEIKNEGEECPRCGYRW